MDIQTIESNEVASPNPRPHANKYRAVMRVLIGAALIGALGAFLCGVHLSDRILLDVALTLGIALGVLVGVAAVQDARTRQQSVHLENVLENAAAIPAEIETEAIPAVPKGGPPLWRRSKLLSRVGAILISLKDSLWTLSVSGRIQKTTAALGSFGIGLILFGNYSSSAVPSAFAAISVAAAFLFAAGFAGTAVSYLNRVEPQDLPEAIGLSRGARVVCWILIAAAICEGLAYLGQQTSVQIVHFAILAIDGGVCYGLFTSRQHESRAGNAFPLDIGVLSALGSRTNILASVLDAGERQLGIDLRSTWALTVVRRSTVPLLIGLVLLGWLSTSLTVVGVDEQGLIERFGVSVSGPLLSPGLHVHWPWPIDHILRIPVLHVQEFNIGHEVEEAGGPENVIWTVEHAPNELDLLTGNGRDLLAIDDTVQYRITDARAWRYNCQNPADALKAIAYRAVMRNTVDRTLSDALSENVVTVTETMRSMVQQDADALGLGVTIENFTVGGMHPPVPVAADYEGVVSAQLGEVTAVANAQGYKNQTIPSARALVVTSENAARADGAQELGLAAGEAWSFRALESQYRAAPEEYFFRRRLEALETGLAGRPFTIVDSRIQRDGGELWLTQ